MAVPCLARRIVYYELPHSDELGNNTLHSNIDWFFQQILRNKLNEPQGVHSDDSLVRLQEFGAAAQTKVRRTARLRPICL